MSLAVLAVAIIALFALSRIPIRFVIPRTTLFVPIFAGLIALPLAFMTPGTPIGTIGYDGLVLTVSREGLSKATLFTFRIWVCVAAAVLLTSTTKFADLIHAMERLKLPKILVMLMAISYRFIYLFVEEAYRLVLAMESRTVRRRRWKNTIQSLGSIMAALFIRSHERGERVYLAMKARAYRGTIVSLEATRLTFLDLLSGTSCFLFCLAVVLIDLHLVRF
jgi:cobalt ECF transporter T component CbiQ